MFTVEQLSEKINAYEDGRMPFDEFEDWYRTHSWGFYDQAGKCLSDVIAAVEAAFSEYEYGEITESAFRKELANAIRPFVEAIVKAVLSSLDAPLPEGVPEVERVRSESSIVVARQKPVGSDQWPYSQSEINFEWTAAAVVVPA